MQQSRGNSPPARGPESANAAANRPGTTSGTAPPPLKMVVLRNAWQQHLAIADATAASAAGAYTWASSSAPVTPAAHVSILRYVAQQPPVPLYKPESGVQVLFRFGTPPRYVGTEQDAVLKVVQNPNSFCIWTMQAFEGGFFSLTHPTKRVLIVKDGSLALGSLDAGWEKMFKMEMAAGASLGRPTSNARPPSNSRQSTAAPPAAAPAAQRTPSPPANNGVVSSIGSGMRPPSGMAGPGGPGGPGPMMMMNNNGGPGPGPMGMNGPPRPPMMGPGGPGGPGGPRPPMMGGPGGPGGPMMGGPGGPGMMGPGGPRPPMMGGPGGPMMGGPGGPGMMGGPGGPGGPRPPMMGPGPNGPPGPGGPPRPPPGPTANLTTPVSMVDIKERYIERDTKAKVTAGAFKFAKFDIKKESHRAAYFTISLVSDTKMWRVDTFDLNQGHKAKMVLQCADTELYLAVDKDFGTLTERADIDHAAVWEFLKLPHNPLAFALAHPEAKKILVADAKDGALTLVDWDVPGAAPKPSLASSFMLFMPASIAQAVQAQNAPQQPWIQKAMPYISAVSAIGGLATAGALVGNLMKANAVQSAPQAPAHTTTSTVPNKLVDDSGASSSSAAGAAVTANHLTDANPATDAGFTLDLGTTAHSEAVTLADGSALPAALPAALPSTTADSPAAAPAASAAHNAVDDTSAPASDDVAAQFHALDAAIEDATAPSAGGWDIGGAGMDDADVAALVHDFGAADLAAGGDGGADHADMAELGLVVDDHGNFHHVGGFDGGEDGGHHDGGGEHH
ncbi:hypothetical protein H9P43_009159 [Blastocladiella emersonii ATCC 22665]|nr:hypothetical protein H9P43_009159 [Blastocladiella emersonii ATCC 22665]